MKLLFDFFPVILFFIAYHSAGALTANTPLGELLDSANSGTVNATLIATGVAIIASFIQVGWHWARTHGFEKAHIYSLVLITLLGGITILLANPVFIQWKPTLLYWTFAIVFLGSMHFGDRNISERMMGGQLELPDFVWARLNLAWIVFFLLAGLANLYVAFWHDIGADEAARMDVWVNFKLFGLLGMTLIFVILQALYLSRFIDDDEDQRGDT